LAIFAASCALVFLADAASSLLSLADFTGVRLGEQSVQERLQRKIQADHLIAFWL
jgi:hypothetical protein